MSRRLTLALFSAVGVSLTALVLAAAFRGPISRGLGVPSLQGLLLLLPIGIVATGAVLAMNYLALRRKIYGPVMRSKVAQGVGTATGQISLTMAGFAGGGLVVEGGRRAKSDECGPLIARLPFPPSWRCVVGRMALARRRASC
jgi:hypothetical protein